MTDIKKSSLEELAALNESMGIAPAAPAETTAPAGLASADDIADALAFVTAADTAADTLPAKRYDANDDRSTARGVGSITMRSGRKVVAQRVDFSVAKMDEAEDLRQSLIDEGKLTEHPNFLDDMAAIINPVSARNELRPFSALTVDLAKLEALPGTRANYPHVANAAEDVAQTILSMCRNPADAEMIAAIASCLPDYLRHQQKQRHISNAAEAHADAAEKHIAKEMQSALKRLEFFAGLANEGGTSKLAADLAQYQKDGDRLSIRSRLGAAEHLLPLLQFHDAKQVEQVLCEIAQYIPENGHRFSAVVLVPDSSYRPELTYTDPDAAPKGYAKGEVSFNFSRIDADTVHIVLRERVLSASTWSQAADLNPFVVVGAWDVNGCESGVGTLAVDAAKVRTEQARNLAFLKGEAESAGSSLMFPAHWQKLNQTAANI